MHHDNESSFVDEFQWFSPLHYLKIKRTRESSSSLVHVASGAAIFTLLLRRRVAFLHRTATCRPLFKPSVSLFSTYKTIELCFEFLSHFKSFHLTLPRIPCFFNIYFKLLSIYNYVYAVGVLHSDFRTDILPAFFTYPIRVTRIARAISKVSK